LSEQNDTECWLDQPIEIVLSITDTFKWRDQLEQEYGVNIPESAYNLSMAVSHDRDKELAVKATPSSGYAINEMNSFQIQE
jgi:hypothetical protein